MTLMWHPGTGATFDAPSTAVAVYRQSGWLLASERDEHEQRAADRAELEKAEQSKAAKAAPTDKGK
jgi:hypothetical protein